MNKKKIVFLVLMAVLLVAVSLADIREITGFLVKSPSGNFEVDNFPPVITVDDFIGDAGDLVTIDPVITDPNGDAVTKINYSSPLNSSGQWQTEMADYGIHEAVVFATDGNSWSNQTFAIKLRPYCGDGICNYLTAGEQCLNCPEDCGACPEGAGNGTETTGVTYESGGRGIGPAGPELRALQEELNRLKEQNESGGAKVIDQFKPEVESIYVKLQEDEFISKQIMINNYLSETIFIRVGVTGEVNNSVVMDSSYFMVPGKSSKNLELIILANQPVGEYEGEITLVSSNTFQIIPITLKVTKRLAKPELETVDLNIDLITHEVNPGGMLRFKLMLRKAPLINEDPEEVFLKYLITSLDQKNLGLITGAAVADMEDIAAGIKEAVYLEESVFLSNILSLPKEVEIPAHFSRGEYILSVNVDFNGRKIPLFTKFKVNVPWHKEKLFNIEKGFLALFFLMIMLAWMAFLMSRMHYHGWKRFKVDLYSGSLPKNGPRSAYIGYIAEKNRPAYLNLEDLKTHILVAGTTGSGKTVAAQVIVEEALEKGVAVVVFDPTAQWTGFLKKCESRSMLKYYSQFRIKDPQNYGGTIYNIKDAGKKIDFQQMIDKRISILLLNQMDPKELNRFISGNIFSLFKEKHAEQRKLKMLLVFDEVHRLLPAYGGSKEGYRAIERAVREFRKWGIGVVLVSQITEDLLGPIEANVATQIQMKTNDRSDLARIEKKYSEEFVKAVARAPVGTGLLSNSSYNKGRPYFVAFRPIKHNVKGLNKEELESHLLYSRMLSEAKEKISRLEAKKKEAADLKIELELAEKQLDEGRFELVKIYLDGIKAKLEKRLKSGKRLPDKNGKKR